MQQLARRIVDEDQKAALRAAVLKPPVLRPVDLNELAATIPAVAWLIGTGPPGFAVLPKTSLDHQESERLTSQVDVVALGKILTGQGRTEIAVMGS